MRLVLGHGHGKFKQVATKLAQSPPATRFCMPSPHSSAECSGVVFLAFEFREVLVVVWGVLEPATEVCMAAVHKNGTTAAPLEVMRVGALYDIPTMPATSRIPDDSLHETVPPIRRRDNPSRIQSYHNAGFAIAEMPSSTRMCASSPQPYEWRRHLR